MLERITTVIGVVKCYNRLAGAKALGGEIFFLWMNEPSQTLRTGISFDETDV
jgi:hypothetical protein